MIRVIISFGALLILNSIHASPLLQENAQWNSNGNILIVKDIKEYEAKNPGVNLLELKPTNITARSTQQRTTQYTYVFSGGTHFESDRLLVRGYDTNEYTSTRTLKAVMQYPDPNTVPTSLGPIINYFEVSIYQSNNMGRAYVVDGGIGFRKISIVVEMVDTLFYGIIALIYGYN